jgi:hypothetical protein
MIYLIAGLLWMLAGAGILVYHTLHPESRFLWVPLWDLPPFSSGWVALFFSVYCFLRWWMHRAHRAAMLANYERLQQREEERLRRRRTEQGEPPPPDPNLDFSDKPLPPLPGEKPQG